MAYQNRKICYFCKNKTDVIDSTDASLLKKYLNYSDRINPRKKTGNCTKHQRLVSKAIKKARNLGIIK